MRKLILVRHALTDFNRVGGAGRICGISDPPLSAEGRAEADQLGQNLLACRFDSFFVSPLRRAVETAEPIGRAVGMVPRKELALRELDYGLWEGLSKEEISQRFPEQWRRFVSDPFANFPPGGDDPSVVIDRVTRWLDRALGGSLLIVGHKGIFRLLLCRLMGLPLGSYREALDIKIAGISVLVETPWGMRLDALNFGATRRRVLPLP